MHNYLKSIGFRDIKTSNDLDDLIADVLMNHDHKKVVETEDGQVFAEISKEYAMDMGITVCGIYDEENLFHIEYYYPYFIGSQVTSCHHMSIEKRISQEAYSGACDDVRVGTMLIFYLLNAADYIRASQEEKHPEKNASISYSAMVARGLILLPVEKTPAQAMRNQKKIEKKNNLYLAAANGDESAMESLTMDDIDVYSMISRRIQKKEDVYTIVDSYFMPYGFECDLYNVMGEITGCREVRNMATNEKVYHLNLVCNGIPMDLCASEKDLTGIPEVGRRFKGIIWMQGYAHFV